MKATATRVAFPHSRTRGVMDARRYTGNKRRASNTAMAVDQHCRLVDVVSPVGRAAPYPAVHPRAVIEVSRGKRR